MRGLLLSSLLLLSACKALDAGPSDLEVLEGWMVGSFSTAAQAAADPEIPDMRLHVTPIWRSRQDGKWLYVERAVATQPDRPYRQRVYNLRAAGGAIVCDVYELPGNPLRFAGAWANPAMLDEITPEQLAPRTGCSLEWTRQADGSFRGATGDKSCPSDLQGARYATSEATATATLVTTWDRGFDLNGKQVWGATQGAYQFARVSTVPGEFLTAPRGPQ